MNSNREFRAYFLDVQYYHFIIVVCPFQPPLHKWQPLVAINLAVNGLQITRLSCDVHYKKIVKIPLLISYQWLGSNLTDHHFSLARNIMHNVDKICPISVCSNSLVQSYMRVPKKLASIHLYNPSVSYLTYNQFLSSYFKWHCITENCEKWFH